MADEVNVGKVNVKFFADTKDFQEGLKKAQDKLKGFEDKTGKSGTVLQKLQGKLGDVGTGLKDVGKAAGISTDSFDKISDKIGSFAKLAESAGGSMFGLSRGALLFGAAAGAIGVAAIGGAIALGHMAVEAGAVVEEQDMLAQRTGLAIDTLQRWKVAMAETNIGSTELTGAMTTLSRKVAEAADENSNAAQTFELMGMDIHNLGSTEDILRTLADRFSRMPDGIEKSRVAVELLGRGGLSLIPILNQGAEGLARSAKVSEELGAVLRKEQIQVLKDVDDAWDRVGVAMEGFKANVGSLAAPAFEKLFDWLAKIIGKANEAAQALSKVISPDKKPSVDDSSKLPGQYLEKREEEIRKEQIAAGIARGEPEKGAAIVRGAQTTEMLKGINAQRQLPDLSADSMGSKTPQQLMEFENKRMMAAIKLVELRQQEAKFASAIAAMQNDIQKGLDKEVQDRSEAFAAAFENGQILKDLEQDKIRALKEGSYAQAEMIQLQIEEAEALMHTMTLTRSKISTQEELGRRMVASFIEAYNVERQEILKNRALRDADHAKTVENLSVASNLQEKYAQIYMGSFGSADKAREIALAREAAGHQQSLDMLNDKLADGLIVNDEYYRQVTNLELQAETERIAIIQRYPTFFEQQMQQLVQSNVFSLAQISSNFTNATASWIVTGRGFEQFWTQLQITLVQAALNTAIQQTAIWLLADSQKTAVEAAGAAARITIKTTEAGTVIAIDSAKNAAIVSGNAAAATATTSIWAGAAAGISGAFGVIMGAFRTMVSSMVEIMLSVGSAVIGFLEAIAAALTATVFGIPWAGAILVGVGLIIGALAAFDVLEFAKGGIVTGPTLGMVGEAGSSEAIIPLNSRGAGFMADMMGMGANTRGTTTQYISIELNGRTIAEAVADDLPSVLQLQGVPAV